MIELAKFSRTLQAALLGFALPLLLIGSGWGQTSPADLQSTDYYIEQLKDEDPNNDEDANKGLKKIGEAAVEPLVKELQDSQEPKIRDAMVKALGEIGPKAKQAVIPLRNVLRTDGDEVRASAASSLGEIGGPKAVSVLIEVFKKDNHPGVRFKIIVALEKIQHIDAETIGIIIHALEDEDSGVRDVATIVLEEKLGKIKSRDILDKAIADLTALLEKQKDWQVRLGAAEALGGSGRDVKAAVSAIADLLQDKDEEVRRNAIERLGWIAEKIRQRKPYLSLDEKENAREGLDQAINALKSFKGDGGEDREEVIDSLKKTQNEIKPPNSIINSIRSLISEYPKISFAASYIIFLLCFWSIVLRVRPLLILQINEFLRSHADFELPERLGGIKIPTRYGILVGFFNYHPRVLDAWVARHIDTARCEFEEKQTVKERDIYVPVPVIMDGKNIANLTALDLQPKLAQKLECILIWGEGGAGKTSLACQLAKWAMSDDPEQRLCKHRMLPILLEKELDLQVSEGKPAFTEAIRGLLKDLINSQEPIAEELLEQLLRQQRLLVIVDSFSEMSEATRKQIDADDPDFPVNALVVTSRLEEDLGVNKTVLQPMRVEPDRISSFMEAYLTQRGKRNLFNDSEFDKGKKGLSDMAGKHITVLLATLYAEQMIAKAERAIADLPDNIPELMLHYLNQLNRNLEDNKLDDRAVHRVAKAIAWQCLKRTYRPAEAKRDDILTALDRDDAAARLDYLENRLRVIQTVGAAKDKIRFALDPLAEYLAALQMVELYGDNEQSWRDFFAKADPMPEPSNKIQGFLLAVGHCCQSQGKEADLPDFVRQELDRRTNLDI